MRALFCLKRAVLHSPSHRAIQRQSAGSSVGLKRTAESFAHSIDRILRGIPGAAHGVTYAGAIIPALP